ncbi:DUF1963 domain-containing protein [Chitinophaga sp. B61]|uniref:DUF1963 domain-containing protein n=1 Tax=Chitinophaga rhizophila TaxID=2866212 RepID=A0ABS7GKQ6_9BACT|nr:DUF1963 domain-containing protein [Chitinophaga rhizophila]
MKGEQVKDNEYVSFVTLGLNEVSFYDQYPGNDLIARFKASCMEQRGEVTLINDKTLPVAGQTAYVRTAKADIGFFYYFGFVQISNEYCYTMIGDCDVEDSATYEPLFDDIWQSLQYFGNPAQELTKQKAEIDAIFSRYDTSEDEPPESKLEVEPFSVPEDGQEYWEMAGLPFQLLPVKDVYISDGDGALYVKLEAMVEDYSDEKYGHILNDYEDGKIYMQFYFKKIYQAGIPTGVFTFEDERDSSYLSYLWKGGFEYTMNFSGEATLKEGWLGINGQFADNPVRIAVKLPVQELDWTKYRFLHTDELETAPADIVHHLQLTDPYPAILQEVLHPLTQLESLNIDYNSNNKHAADLREVPKAIKRFKALKSLTLRGISGVDSLPQWIGDLKELETLHINGSSIEGIHPYVFQLPKLKYCYLSHNQLQSISPQAANALETLILDNNKFTSIPDVLIRMKSLKRLNIEDNPLTSLPAGLEKIDELILELEKKMTLLDYSYKGADGQGTVAYDDSLFFSANDPALATKLEEAVKAQGLEEYLSGLSRLGRKAVALATTEEDDYATPGNIRFGGLPDLPADIPYPYFKAYNGEQKAMQFLAQINCANIAHLQDYLPRTGMLYFFIEDQEDLNPKVIYYNGEASALQPGNTLNITEEDVYDERGLYTPFKAVAESYPDVPSFYNARDYYKGVSPELSALEEMDNETEALKDAVKPATEPVHSINSYVFKQHDTPEKEAVHALRGKPEDWMVLLRVSSDNNTGFSFWDAGEIYFVIHKSDLAKANFSNIYAGLESS